MDLAFTPEEQAFREAPCVGLRQRAQDPCAEAARQGPALGALGLDEQVRHGRAIEFELVLAVRGDDGGLEGRRQVPSESGNARSRHLRQFLYVTH